jgi:hypothetical protein
MFSEAHPEKTDALAGNTPEDWSEPVHGAASLLRLGRLCLLVGGCALRSERNLVYLSIRRQGIECAENHAKR